MTWVGFSSVGRMIIEEGDPDIGTGNFQVFGGSSLGTTFHSSTAVQTAKRLRAASSAASLLAYLFPFELQ
jgi:hypothetical protein